MQKTDTSARGADDVSFPEMTVGTLRWTPPGLRDVQTRARRPRAPQPGNCHVRAAFTEVRAETGQQVRLDSNRSMTWNRAPPSVGGGAGGGVVQSSFRDKKPQKSSASTDIQWTEAENGPYLSNKIKRLHSAVHICDDFPSADSLVCLLHWRSTSFHPAPLRVNVPFRVQICTCHGRSMCLRQQTRCRPCAPEYCTPENTFSRARGSHAALLGLHHEDKGHDQCSKVYIHW